MLPFASVIIEIYLDLECTYSKLNWSDSLYTGALESYCTPSFFALDFNFILAHNRNTNRYFLIFLHFRKKNLFTKYKYSFKSSLICFYKLYLLLMFGCMDATKSSQVKVATLSKTYVSLKVCWAALEGLMNMCLVHTSEAIITPTVKHVNDSIMLWGCRDEDEYSQT